MCGISTDEYFIHDSDVYGYKCDCATGVLVLHTSNEYPEPNGSYVDVIFSGVEVHQIEDVCRGNILFDIYENQMPEVGGDRRFIDKSIESEYGEYLVQAIGKDCKLYEISSSFGMSGWVAAQSVDLVKREHRVADICVC